MRFCKLLMISLFGSGLLWAQTNLQGTTVTVKMDLPASSDGVDIRPLGTGIDFKKLNDRLRRYGVGVHTGESIMITKVVVKKDHIEVHLGGGGYGTFADRLEESSAAPVVPYEFKSRREKDLEEDAKYDSDYWRRERARRELEDERRERDRNNAQATVINAQTRSMAKANADAKRGMAGSRFNIWYADGIPEGASSSAGIESTLAKYADFGRQGSSVPIPTDTHGNGPVQGLEPPIGTGLRKGMTIMQVEGILGPADSASKQMDGSMETVVREYSGKGGQKATTKFVGGVLVDYKVVSQ